jgi:hypothetical protein
MPSEEVDIWSSFSPKPLIYKRAITIGSSASINIIYDLFGLQKINHSLQYQFQNISEDGEQIGTIVFDL